MSPLGALGEKEAGEMRLPSAHVLISNGVSGMEWMKLRRRRVISRPASRPSPALLLAGVRLDDGPELSRAA